MWNWEKYLNGSAVKKLEDELWHIDPTLGIGGITVQSDKAIVHSIDVSLPERGNKKIITQLRNHGYQKVCRTKRGDDYCGYAFCITMRKTI